MSDPRTVIRYLGGESGHRSFFGGTHSRTRVVFLTVSVLAGMVLTPLIGWPALAVTAGSCGVTLLVTARTHRGSIVDRRRKRFRWNHRRRTGTDTFVPYEVGAWDQLQQTLDDALTVRGKAGRQAARAADRAVTAMRANPDGSDGLGWLQHGRGEPGIAWHAPIGEQPYLSVTFAVTGQLRGIESASVMARAAHGWGVFLAVRAAPSVLVSDVQVTTRVLPSDSALQEFWVLNSLDPAAPREAISSYEEVLRLTGTDAMVQRHFVTVTWPLTGAFHDAAAKYGAGREGWRGLMRQEIASTARGLGEAKMGRIDVLTARQTTALIRHQQNPTRPLDFVADVVPERLGEASHDEYSAHVVDGTDPSTGAPVEWWHRTAAIRAEALSTAPRTQLWVLDLLVGRDLQFIRTVSFHLHLVPAVEAKAAARQDLTRDTAEALSRREGGQVDTDDTDVQMTAARRRGQDLVAGSHHHGATWIGYVTISARTRDELARASRQLEETCSTGLGIERLDWLDSYQAAASGTTWPIGRGLRAAAPSFSSRVYTRLAGRSDKEAIS
ncbi:hypothetical protein E3O44_06870 [Cryobacterium algoricola]|uniref:PrgI family protein n=1 Tax=Cryobacterium algoricola TaxID=1259183 RepID=A0ABY2IBP4_9MICO|nr:SCO6880 family protein [Cryobacterium algoricola]TFB86883.1 hypothetical protein E3O44_06870 [Cryobacterium algoricola]